MNRIIATLILLLFDLTLNAQCNCKSQVENIIKTVKENYPGYAEKNKLKAHKEFLISFENGLLEKSNSASKEKCDTLLKHFIDYFDDLHLRIAKQQDDNKFKLLTDYKYLKDNNLPNLSFEKLSTKTNYIQIKSFDYQNKSKIDSLINVNKKSIYSTENLIIDLRGNGGGNDPSYKELLPIIYSNPIRKLGIEKLAGEANIQQMEDFYNSIKNNKDYSTEVINELKSNIDKLKANKNQYVSVWEKDLYIDNLSISQIPRNVVILIDKSVGSTTEQFVLEAKQSKKVKVLGTPSSGTIDFSNMYWKQFKCEKSEFNYALGIASTRSMRLPEFQIDPTGIQPDIYIDKTINDWKEFAQEYLEN